MNTRRLSLAAVVSAGALLLAVACSLAIGAQAVDPAVVWNALQYPDQPSGQELIVQARVPRTVDGLLAGAALAVAGTAIQGATRNPFGDPGVLGMNAGAVMGVVLVLALVPGPSGALGATAAFVGALVTTLLVYLIAGVGAAQLRASQLALAGAAISAGFASLSAALLLSMPKVLDRFRHWQAGVLGAGELATVGRDVALLTVGGGLCLAAASAFNLVRLGDDLAASLGARVKTARVVAGVGAAVLVGMATARIGPVAFVGLIVPHALRHLVTQDYRLLIPLAAGSGATLLLAADVLGRVVAPPAEVQVGVVTALLGAPLLVWLARRGGRVEL